VAIDRVGRSLQDSVGFLSELHALGIDLFLHQQGLDTTTPSGKAMLQMMVKMPDNTERAIRAALSKRDQPGLRKIAAAVGVGVGTVQRVSRELASSMA
jgi:hypothetical protein